MMVVKDLTAAVVTIAFGKMLAIVAPSANLSAMMSENVQGTTPALQEPSFHWVPFVRSALSPSVLRSVLAMELVSASLLL